MENKAKRTFESQPTLTGRAHLEATGPTPALEKITPEIYSRLNPKQREELVNRLIDFIKSF